MWCVLTSKGKGESHCALSFIFIVFIFFYPTVSMIYLYIYLMPDPRNFLFGIATTEDFPFFPVHTFPFLHAIILSIFSLSRTPALCPPLSLRIVLLHITSMVEFVRHTNTCNSWSIDALLIITIIVIGCDTYSHLTALNICLVFTSLLQIFSKSKLFHLVFCLLSQSVIFVVSQLPCPFIASDV